MNETPHSKAAFAINTYSFSRDRSAHDCLQHLADVGYRRFEVMLIPGHFWPTLDGAAGTRGVHQHAPHHPCRGREKVGAVLPSDDAPVEESNVGLLHEVCRLPAIALTLARQHPPCHAAKFEVHERGELFESLRVSAAPGLQQAGQVRDTLGHYPASLLGDESGRLHFVPADSACARERTTERSALCASKESI